MIRRMLKKKDLEMNDMIGAIIRNDITAVKQLLDSGTDINKQDGAGFTALHFAAQENNFGIAKLLIERGADLEIRDVYGNTPLIRAVSSSKGKGEIIDLLLQHGADMNVKNDYGVSALEDAKNIGNYNIFQFFEKYIDKK